MEHIQFGVGNGTALRFGDESVYINVVGSSRHVQARPWPGSVDLRFLVDDIDAVAAHLDAWHVLIVDGTGPRSGARGKIRSFYMRDLDGNTTQLSAYV